MAFQQTMKGLRQPPESELGKLCEDKLKTMMQQRIKWLKSPDDGMVCGIQGFIHEVNGEKLKAKEFYEKIYKINV